MRFCATYIETDLEILLDIYIASNMRFYTIFSLTMSCVQQIVRASCVYFHFFDSGRSVRDTDQDTDWETDEEADEEAHVGSHLGAHGRADVRADGWSNGRSDGWSNGRSDG